MNRDMELVRTILQQAEAATPPMGEPAPDASKVDGYDDLTVARHIELLEEAGLVKANLMRVNGSVIGLGYGVTRLTWSGHEFLTATKNDTVWAKTKDFITKQGGGASFEIIKAVATRFATNQFGLSEI